MPPKRTAVPEADAGIPQLRVSTADARVKLSERVTEGESLVKSWEASGARIDNDECRRQTDAWDNFNKTLLTSLFAGPLFLDQYKRSGISVGFIDLDEDPYGIVRSCVSTIRDKSSRLTSIAAQLDLCPGPAVPPSSTRSAPTASDRVRILCRRFPIFARQLQKRYNQRQPFLIDDEYDVQDLMHALLRVEFDDVRSEAWTPSYAGKSSRMDFLLKRERLVLEAKKTRDGLGSKELGDQLIIDIDRYKEHADCGTLICFVYDPDRRVGNPAELEDDLSGTRGALDVYVVVAPRE
jgi:hypothetical protein